MPQAKRKPAAKKKAAKRKPAAKRPPEPEVQVDRQTTPPKETKPVTDPHVPNTPTPNGEASGSDPHVPNTPTQDPPLFEGTPNELDENGETQADRDAAGLEREKKVRTPGKPDAPEDYEPKRDPLEHADFDHHAAEEKRQDELDIEREEHNERTGDASLAKGTWS